MLHNLDSDSSKIIEAVRSTGVVITEAMRLYVDYIVSNMKAIGTRDLCNAVYGFVGGTADSHKWNWKDLRDVDAAFRLTYGTSSLNHSSFGLRNLNTNSFDNTNFVFTKIIPSSHLSLNSVHLSAYMTISGGNSALTAFDLGCGTLSGGIVVNNLCLVLRPIENNGVRTFLNTNTGYSNLVGGTKGYVLSSRNSSSLISVGYNGVLTTNVASTSTSLTSEELTLTRLNNGLGITTPINLSTYGFFSIGSGLTDTQALQQSQIVTNAQNILNRA